MAQKTISRSKTRDSMVKGLVLARICGSELNRIEEQIKELQARGAEITQNQLQHLSRANLAADLLGYENLDKAFEDITPEERDKTEQELLAEQNGNH